jgi:hypothetical protein
MSWQPAHVKFLTIRRRCLGIFYFTGFWIFARIAHPIILQNCTINEPIGLRNADAFSVNLHGSSVAGVQADGLRTRGNVFLRDGFHATGGVRLPGAKIGDDLDCLGGTFEIPNGKALYLNGAKVTTTLFLAGSASPPAGDVDLRSAQVGDLVDDEKSWPAPGKLYPDGFVYSGFSREVPWRAYDQGVRRGRLYSLGLEHDFHPQPYEQLSRVFREMGQEQEAREVAIAEKAQLRKHGGLGALSRFWNWFLGVTISYGYHPGRVLLYLFGVWLVGAFMFWAAKRKGVKVPAGKEAYDLYETPLASLPPGYPRFSAPLYALDLIVPGIDMRQKSKWRPYEKQPGDRWYWVWGDGDGRLCRRLLGSDPHRHCCG